MTLNNHAILSAVDVEIDRQDKIHPDGYPATRDGIRLALAAAEDELIEAREAWRTGRCKCSTPRCDHHDWSHACKEMIQAAAVLIRSAREVAE